MLTHSHIHTISTHNTHTYTQTQPTHTQAGDLAAATALLDTHMPRDNVTPSGITVCALLNALWRWGKVEEGLALFESLPSRGLPRDARVRFMSVFTNICICVRVCAF